MLYCITCKFGPSEQDIEILVPANYDLAEEKVAKLCQSLRYEGAIDVVVRLVNRSLG